MNLALLFVSYYFLGRAGGRCRDRKKSIIRIVMLLERLGRGATRRARRNERDDGGVCGWLMYWAQQTRHPLPQPLIRPRPPCPPFSPTPQTRPCPLLSRPRPPTCHWVLPPQFFKVSLSTVTTAAASTVCKAATALDALGQVAEGRTGRNQRDASSPQSTGTFGNVAARHSLGQVRWALWGAHSSGVYRRRCSCR